eukprot:1159764-Pelagomonas_calceolata.AAC.17
MSTASDDQKSLLGRHESRCFQMYERCVVVGHHSCIFKGQLIPRVSAAGLHELLISSFPKSVRGVYLAGLHIQEQCPAGLAARTAQLPVQPAPALRTLLLVSTSRRCGLQRVRPWWNAALKTETPTCRCALEMAESPCALEMTASPC